MRRVARIAAFAVLLGSACSSSSGPGASEGSPSPGPGGTATGAGITLEAPRGWFAQEVTDRGLVVATTELDVEALVATGPRFEARPAPTEAPDPAVVLAVATTEQASISDPTETTVDGKRGIAVEETIRTSNGTVRVREIVVGLGGGAGAYEITLEARADEWDTVLPTLQGILDSVRFTGS